MRWRGLVAWGVVAVCGGVPRGAWALLQTCTVSAVGVNFGTYNPLSLTAATATGTVNVTCTLGLFSSWTVTLSTGDSNSFAQRVLENGAASLGYNLYTSAAYSSVWGDGTGGTGVQSGTQTLGTTNVTYTVYGRIPARQDVAAGSYLDTITVTVSY